MKAVLFEAPEGPKTYVVSISIFGNPISQIELFPVKESGLLSQNSARQ
jgi:hypothetical protein